MLHSVLIIGQSNMAGRGVLEEAVEIDTHGMFVLRNGRWQPFFRPINPDRPFSGVNLAESFCEKYASTHNVNVGIIPCADGGTTLDQWRVGGLLYDNAVFNAKLAQRSSTIVAVLWHQGESDSNADTYNESYGQRLALLFDSLRRELKLFDVPFILGGLGDFLKDFPQNPFVYREKITDISREYAKATPMTGFAEATGLEQKGDNLHFSSKALHEFGLRYYAAFEKLEDKNKQFEEKPFNDELLATSIEHL